MTYRHLKILGYVNNENEKWIVYNNIERKCPGENEKVGEEDRL